MKTIICKNNDFKTVGLEITANARRVYAWGISPSSPFVWTKEVTTSEWITQIAELIAIQEALNIFENMVSLWFSIAKNNPSVHIDEGQGVNFKEIDEKINQLKDKRQAIVENII